MCVAFVRVVEVVRLVVVLRVVVVVRFVVIVRVVEVVRFVEVVRVLEVVGLWCSVKGKLSSQSSVLKTSGMVFAISTSQPANNIYISQHNILLFFFLVWEKLLVEVHGSAS